MRAIASFLAITLSSLLISACGSDNDKGESVSKAKPAPLHYRYSLKTTAAEAGELQNQITLRILDDDKTPQETVELEFTYHLDNQTLDLRPLKALSEDTCYQLAQSAEISLDEFCTGLIKQVKEVVYFNDNISSYTNYQKLPQYARVNEVTYDNSGSDGIWFNGDDSIDSYGYQSHTKTQYVGINIQDYGDDEIWFTEDDADGGVGFKLSSEYGEIEVEVDNNSLSVTGSSKSILISNAASYMLFDSPIEALFAHIFHQPLEFTSLLILDTNSFYIAPTMIYGSGEDNQYFTEDDDIVGYRGQEVTIDGNNRRVNYFSGMDNRTESIVAYSLFIYDNQILREQQLYGHETHDPFGLKISPIDENNPSQVIHYIYDENQTLAYKTNFYSNNKKREDDYDRQYLNSKTTYDGDKETTITFPEKGQGEDGEWFTEDDDILSYQIDSDTFYAKASGPGDDQIWLTSDDELENCHKTLVLHPDEITTETYKLACTRLDDELIPELNLLTSVEQHEIQGNEWGQLTEDSLTDAGPDKLLNTIDDDVRTTTHYYDNHGYKYKTTFIHGNSSTITHFEITP